MNNQSKLIKISQKTNGRCFYCNNDGEVIDHFISKAKWVEWGLDNIKEINLDSIENLFLSCAKCNISKRDKCPEDFIGNSYKAWKRYYKANNRIESGLNFEYIF